MVDEMMMMTHQRFSSTTLAVTRTNNEPFGCVHHTYL